MSIALDSPRMVNLIGPVLEVLKEGEPHQKVWNLSYTDYLEGRTSGARRADLGSLPAQALRGPKVALARGGPEATEMVVGRECGEVRQAWGPERLPPGAHPFHPGGDRG